MNKELERLRRCYDGREPTLLGAKHRYAVLCPLVETEGALHLLFEVRSATVRQGGEVCFPGGRMEAGESRWQCALRETEEELSIPPRFIHPLGEMDFICNQRGFLLHPMLGTVEAEGLRYLVPSPAEVAEVFTVPLAFFKETPPQSYRYQLLPQVPAEFPYEAVGISRDYPWSGGTVEVPVWHYEGHVIWGMTGRIVKALAEEN